MNYKLPRLWLAQFCLVYQFSALREKEKVSLRWLRAWSLNCMCDVTLIARWNQLCECDYWHRARADVSEWNAEGHCHYNQFEGIGEKKSIKTIREVFWMLMCARSALIKTNKTSSPVIISHAYSLTPSATFKRLSWDVYANLMLKTIGG